MGKFPLVQYKGKFSLVNLKLPRVRVLSFRAYAFSASTRTRYKLPRVHIYSFRAKAVPPAHRPLAAREKKDFFRKKFSRGSLKIFSRGSLQCVRAEAENAYARQLKTRTRGSKKTF